MTITKEISEATIDYYTNNKFKLIFTKDSFPTLGTYSTLSFANDVPFHDGR